MQIIVLKSMMQWNSHVRSVGDRQDMFGKCETDLCVRLFGWDLGLRTLQSQSRSNYGIMNPDWNCNALDIVGSFLTP